MSKQEERKLSKAELVRKNEFEKLKTNLESEGYQVKELTMSALAANLLAFVTATPINVLLILLYVMVNHVTEGELVLSLFGSSWFLVVFFVLIVIHELIHGFTWGLFTEKGFRSISFGFIVQYLTPYCTCKEPLKKREMILGGLMPTIILGIIPGIAAVFMESWVVLLMACVMVIGGGADIMMALKIGFYRDKGKEVLYYDHPYKLGTVVFEK